MFKKYIDTGFLSNPLLAYFKWLAGKIRYQTKYWGSHLRIGYKSRAINVVFGKYNWLAENAFVANSSLGDFSYVSDGTVILEAEIGKFCSIGPNVRIAPGKHPTRTIVSTHPAIYSNPPYCLKNFSPDDKHNPYRKVTIGNDVWICANAVISDGITIGDGAIIASNAVVTKNVDPYSIVGGIPARHIRYRFEPEEIQKLLATKWWDKDTEWLEKNAPLLWNVKDYMELNVDPNTKI
ncbi:CatB-related O-acetyltransferase [Mucilaginibacter sp.]|uniref:CatB-related O-acetyltransferase n=1 Tax=Mucilaginibacter sp. TaxID=1882438 RepID=UPI0032665BDF